MQANLVVSGWNKHVALQVALLMPGLVPLLVKWINSGLYGKRLRHQKYWLYLIANYKKLLFFSKI